MGAMNPERHIMISGALYTAICLERMIKPQSIDKSELEETP